MILQRNSIVVMNNQVGPKKRLSLISKTWFVLRIHMTLYWKVSYILVKANFSSSVWRFVKAIIRLNVVQPKKSMTGLTIQVCIFSSINNYTIHLNTTKGPLLNNILKYPNWIWSMILSSQQIVYTLLEWTSCKIRVIGQVLELA